MASSIGDVAGFVRSQFGDSWQCKRCNVCMSTVAIQALLNARIEPKSMHGCAADEMSDEQLRAECKRRGLDVYDPPPALHEVIDALLPECPGAVAWNAIKARVDELLAPEKMVKSPKTVIMTNLEPAPKLGPPLLTSRIEKCDCPACDGVSNPSWRVWCACGFRLDGSQALQDSDLAEKALAEHRQKCVRFPGTETPPTNSDPNARPQTLSTMPLEAFPYRQWEDHRKQPYGLKDCETSTLGIASIPKPDNSHYVLDVDCLCADE